MPPEMNLAQLYLDIADVIIVAINKEELVTEINKKGCEILGYEKKEIVGRNWFDNFLPVRIREEVRPLFHQVMDGDLRLEHYENPILTRDGKERAIAWHNILLLGEGGRPSGTLSSGEDITERKQLEAELETYRRRLEQIVADRTAESAEAHEQLDQEIIERQKAQAGLELRAAILDNAQEAIFLVNPNGNFVYANQAASTAYGYTPDELVCMNLRQLLRPQDAPLVEPRLKEIFTRGRLDLQTVHVRKDGSLMPVLVHNSLTKTPHGEFIVTVVREIAGEFGPRWLLEQLPGILWTTDAELKLTSLMGAGLAALGLRLGQDIGTPLAGFLEASGFGAGAMPAHEAAMAGNTASYEIQNSRSGKTYSGWAAPFRNLEGNPIGAIAVVLETEKQMTKSE
ncbi:MAG: PAS domain S-box protein [Chloroflexi bacterium]|nr:PAS domain S-box protein [Chloroflexota bacterium]